MLDETPAAMRTTIERLTMAIDASPAICALLLLSRQRPLRSLPSIWELRSTKAHLSSTTSGLPFSTR